MLMVKKRILIIFWEFFESHSLYLVKIGVLLGLFATLGRWRFFSKMITGPISTKVVLWFSSSTTFSLIPQMLYFSNNKSPFGVTSTFCSAGKYLKHIEGKKQPGSHEKSNKSSNLLSSQFENPLETKTVCAVQIRQEFIPLLECSVPWKFNSGHNFAIWRTRKWC